MKGHAMTANLISSLKEAVVKMKFNEAEKLATDALTSGASAMEILNQALLPGLDEVGDLFSSGEYFLPDVLMCVKAYNNAYTLISPLLKEGEHVARGTVMLGTVEGDIHEIGKNILIALLQGNGFKVVDLGVQVPPATFLEKAAAVEPDIIGMSSLLTTTMPAMKETIDLFTSRGLRDRYKFIIGGSPVSQRFADEIGADGYGEDAHAGIQLAKKLIGVHP
jgi:corrinoid protein of di/trimethylamine methyltransferase